MAKVDVIIPTHSRAEFLRSALGSVLGQTFQDLAIIVVDDASDDHTPEVVRSFNDERIKYVRMDTNVGEARSRNTGLLHSNAPYVAFLDDDDEWLPQKIELQLQLFGNGSRRLGVVYSGLRVIHKLTGEILREHIPKKRGDIHHDLILGNFVGGPSTVLIRRACFDKVGLFDENIAYLVDYDMWIRLSKEFHFECVEDALVKYHIHENRLSNNLSIRIHGLEAILGKYPHFFELHKKAYGWHYFELACLYRKNREIGKTLRLLLKTVQLSPYDLKNYSKCLGLLLLSSDTYERFRTTIKGVSL